MSGAVEVNVTAQGFFQVLPTDYAWPEVDLEHALLRSIDAELIVAPVE